MWRNVTEVRKPKHDQVAWVKGGDVTELMGSSMTAAGWYEHSGFAAVVDGDMVSLKPEYWWEGNFNYDDQIDLDRMCGGESPAIGRIRHKTSSYWDGKQKEVVMFCSYMAYDGSKFIGSGHCTFELDGSENIAEEALKKVNAIARLAIGAEILDLGVSIKSLNRI